MCVHMCTPTCTTHICTTYICSWRRLLRSSDPICHPEDRGTPWVNTHNWRGTNLGITASGNASVCSCCGHFAIPNTGHLFCLLFLLSAASFPTFSLPLLLPLLVLASDFPHPLPTRTYCLLLPGELLVEKTPGKQTSQARNDAMTQSYMQEDFRRLTYWGSKLWNVQMCPEHWLTTVSTTEFLFLR